MQRQLIESPDVEVIQGGTILFNTLVNAEGDAISYNEENGIFTINQTGYYLVNWWVAADGATTNAGTNYSLNVNGT